MKTNDNKMKQALKNYNTYVKIEDNEIDYWDSIEQFSLPKEGKKILADFIVDQLYSVLYKEGI